jgi:hypothetical protein
MVLAELNIRHTRRHQPTRRVAIGDVYLPTSGPASPLFAPSAAGRSGPGYGGILLGAVVAEHLPDLDEEQRELAPRLLADARDGLSVPRIAMRYRLQTDLHGLDRSRHRIVGEAGRVVLELDRHGWPDPQVIGAVMAAAALPSSARGTAIRAVESALRRPGQLPEGLEVRRLFQGIPGMQPYAPGEGPTFVPWPLTGAGRNGDADTAWSGVPSERRWAMEVLGLRAGSAVDRADVQARFRRLVRQAHPDHGGAHLGAAERLAELSEARELLLGAIASAE